jgi:hypothetical protein
MMFYLRHLRGSENGEAEPYHLERVRIGRHATTYCYGDTAFVISQIIASSITLAKKGKAGSNGTRNASDNSRYSVEPLSP